LPKKELMRLLKFIVTYLLFIGCSQIKENNEIFTSKSSQDGIEILEIAERKKTLPCQNADCTSISIAYPVFDNSPQLNNHIDSIVIAELSNFVQDSTSTSDKDTLMMLFLDSYEGFSKAFPESNNPWYVTIEIAINYHHAEWLSLSLTNQSYTGGAHTSEWVTYLNLDKEGRFYDIVDEIGPLDQLTIAAEAAFKDKMRLSTSDDLGEAGFLFKNNTFHLPANIGINKQSVLLYYNNYEIGSNALGPVLLELPRGKLNVNK
jgi:hypothetical protein|tara:strand:+ start:32375 stop:33157 length:783 start_codon:yes stop_codon:yes gene_type:complete